MQGSHLLMDMDTLSPLAVLDGLEPTALRTAAVSAAAGDLLAARGSQHLVLFDTGPQAHSHIEALRTVRPVERNTVIAAATGTDWAPSFGNHRRRPPPTRTLAR
ncbi:hypothetical protein ACFV80_44945 [Streptomyces sp. NPDC059862]|uniref:hypothetical protein n=1 Tax=Streptomyces sp. NPDC059862 TaxID=3346975 RepID=UPI00364D02CF